MKRELDTRLEELVMEYAGPMGKFFVRKQVQLTNKSLDQLTNGERKELATKIVSVAIYNDKFKVECQNRITKLLNGQGS